MSDFDRIGPRNRIENIEVDEIQAIEDFCDSVKDKTPEEQLEAVRQFLQDNLLNALNPRASVPVDVKRRIWDQDTIKPLSTVFKDKYGVCLDWHVVGKSILDKLGVEAIFQVGRPPWGGPAHTYLDVKLGGKWRIFDPFAEQYLRDQGKEGKLFPREYYEKSFSRKKQ